MHGPSFLHSKQVMRVSVLCCPVSGHSGAHMLDKACLLVLVVGKAGMEDEWHGVGRMKTRHTTWVPSRFQAI